MKIAIFLAVVMSATAAFANLPQPILSLTLNKPVGPIFPVTIANIGAGPASTIVLTAPSPGPEIDVAYKGERLGDGRAPANPILADCSTVATSATQTSVCVLHAALQPGERLQVHYRSASPCTGAALAGATDIRAAAPDELPPGNHMVDLRRACDL